ncbi:MAG: hypothetical protein VXZ00_08865, partial [Pseudomonadota bacterium]|nr:hypothetical protein [Pseudomonadota bacterium]
MGFHFTVQRSVRPTRTEGSPAWVENVKLAAERRPMLVSADDPFPPFRLRWFGRSVSRGVGQR